LQFYKETKKVIGKYLSADYLLNSLLQLRRLKDFTRFNSEEGCNACMSFHSIVSNDNYRVALTFENVEVANDDLKVKDTENFTET
jgi:hypothetical protein